MDLVMHRYVISLIFTLMLSSPVFSATEELARYRYTGSIQNIGFHADATLGEVMTISASGEVEVVTPSNNYRVQGWTTATNLQTDNYIDFGLGLVKEQLKLEQFSIALRRDSLGPTWIQIDLYIDDELHGTVAVMQSLHESTSYITNIIPDPVNLAQSSVVFRLYAWNAGTSAGRLYLKRLSGYNPTESAIIIEGANSEIQPNVKSFTPDTGSTIISSTIDIEFSEEVLTTGDFAELDCMIQGNNRLYNVNFGNGSTAVSGKNILITPSPSLSADDVCELTLIHAFIEDLRGNQLTDLNPAFVPTGASDEYAIYFTPNSLSPTVINSNPVEGQRVTITQDLTVKYSEPVLTPSGVNAENEGYLFSSITCDSSSIPFTFSLLKYDDVGTDLTLNPNANLPFGASCTLDLFGLQHVLSYPTTTDFPSSSIHFSTPSLETYVLIPIINGLIL